MRFVNLLKGPVLLPPNLTQTHGKMPKRPSSIRKLLDYLERVFKRANGKVGLCTGCFQKFPTSKLITAPCEHHYCPSCLRQMSSTALNSPEMFPAKCCSQEIPAKLIVTVMSSQNKKRYIVRWEENNVPPLERLYCPRATCGGWIPPRRYGARLGYCVCPHCRTKVCFKCGDFFHLGLPCSPDSEMKATLQLAKDNNWQRCSNCLYLVEKVDGCNHMICRCGHPFCYLCGQHGQCECSPRGVEDEDLDGNGDLDVGTLVTAMEQSESAGELCW